MPSVDRSPINKDHPHGLTEREAEVYRLTVVNRLTQREIGERLGITQPAVSMILKAAREKIPPPDLNAIRQEAAERHLDVIRRAAELMEMEGAPVTAGKDGGVVYDPVRTDADGKPLVVRDYAGRVQAAKLLLEADRELRKLFGVDAATKQEITGGVRHELVGVDPNELI